MNFVDGRHLLNLTGFWYEEMVLIFQKYTRQWTEEDNIKYMRQDISSL